MRGATSQALGCVGNETKHANRNRRDRCLPRILGRAISGCRERWPPALSCGGPGTLVEVPLGLILAAALAFLAAFTLLVLARTPQIVPWHLVVAVIVGDMVGALILAPLAVGELTPLNAPIVFLALAALGAQPMAAFLGAHTARRVSNDRVQHTGAG